MSDQITMNVVDWVRENGKEYRKRPIKIFAAQLPERCEIKTKEGVMVGEKGDWLIEGVAGEFSLERKEAFNKTHNKA